jgi:hypothetical protein
MGCRGCGPGEYSPEYGKQFKPENNGGCGQKNTGCDTPSNAKEGSPRWEWEQIYGKLVTYFIPMSDENGHTYTHIERLPCPKKTKKMGTAACCSFRYRVVR